MTKAKKEAYVCVGKHPTTGFAMYFDGLEKLAADTGTHPEEWETHEGWVSLETVMGIESGRVAVLAGRLRIREVEE